MTTCFIKGDGDEAVGDLLNVVNPRADVGFHGRRGQFDASYDGAFLLYHDLSTLNSYDQHTVSIARRRISPHVTLFVRNGFAAGADDADDGARRRAVPPHWVDRR